MSRRVVVTGLGLVSPLGCSVELAWQRLLAGQSGICALDAKVCEGIDTRIAGRVPGRDEDAEAGWNADAVVSPKEQRRMDRFIAFALGAAGQALAQARWQAQAEQQQERTATVIASGVGGYGAIAEAVRTTDLRGP